MENWKPVIGYECLYEVSDLGRVRSLDRIVNQFNNGVMTEHFYKGKMLKAKTDKGYYTVKLCNQHNTKHAKVHRIVAEAFITNPERKPLINHKNGIKLDNRVSNIEWCTEKENSQHALKNGLHNPVITEKAREACINACSKQIKCLNNGMIFKSSYDAALWINGMFGNTKKTHVIAAKIRNVCSGNRNQCYGFKFIRFLQGSTTIPQGSTPKWAETDEAFHRL
jgi:hypothetical protein